MVERRPEFSPRRWKVMRREVRGGLSLDELI